MDTESLRETCLSFPGATEGIKWEEHLCFMVGDKMFCITGMEDGSPINIKVPEEEFDELSSRNGIIPAPYMARNKWIKVEKRSAFKAKEWQHYLRQSYDLIRSKLPKKIQSQLGS